MIYILFTIDSIYTKMYVQIGLICISLILGATLIITLLLELIKQNGIQNGTIVTSVIENYKANILQILIAFVWIGSIMCAVELMLTFYDGARMRYRLRIEFFERLEDFYYRQLPQMTLVYTKTPEADEPLPVPPVVAQPLQPPVLHIQPATDPQLQQVQQVQQSPILYAELPPRRQPYRATRRRSYG